MLEELLDKHLPLSGIAQRAPEAKCTTPKPSSLGTPIFNCSRISTLATMPTKRGPEELSSGRLVSRGDLRPVELLSTFRTA